MSNTTTKTWRLGGAAGYSVHGVQALTEGKPTYRRSLNFANPHPVYARVELWKDEEGEANVLCSVALAHSTKRKEVLDQIRGCLHPSMSAEDVKFLCSLICTAYAQRAI